MQGKRKVWRKRLRKDSEEKGEEIKIRVMKGRRWVVVVVVRDQKGRQ